MNKVHLSQLALLIAASALLSACDNSSGNGTGGKFNPQSAPGICPQENLSITICDPAAGPFLTESSNAYFPFSVGNQWILEGEEDGEIVRVEIDVLDETELVNGVVTRVIVETEYEAGELIEISRNFFAQAPDGTVCYFGEDVDNYEDGVVINNDGSWRAGEDSNLAGILMPGSPQVGDAYFSEFAMGEAEDMSEIVAFGDTYVTPFGTYTDTLTTYDTNPLDDCDEVEEKGYARGIGNIDDDGKLLVSFH